MNSSRLAVYVKLKLGLCLQLKGSEPLSNSDGQANGRPVGVVLDSASALLVADDVGNTIWRVSRKAAN